MAKIYEYKNNGSYQYNGNYEVSNLSISDAIDAILGERGDWEHDGKYQIVTEGIRGYWGRDAVMIEIDDGYGSYMPYMIVGN